jgi:TonB family protein
MFSAKKLTLRFLLLISLSVGMVAQAPLGTAYTIGNGVSQPRLIHKIEPTYSEEARQAKWQGTVQLEIVVDEHGVPKDLRVRRALGLGLDEKAIEAVKQWRFQPGQKDGQPVPVIAVIDVSFRLLDDPPQANLTSPPPPPDPAKAAVIEELLILSKVDQLLPQLLELVRVPTQQLIGAGIDQGLPKTIDRQRIASDVQDLQRQVFEAISTRLRAQFAPMFIRIYSDTFTLEQLKDVVAFYKTPSGQALIGKQSEVIAKSSAGMQELTKQYVPDIQKTIRDWVEATNKKYGTP